MTKTNRVNDVATEEKKQKKIEDVIEPVIDDPLPNNDFWWEEDIFDTNDTQSTIDSSKIFYDDIKKETTNILKDIDINALSDNILRNLRPADNRNMQDLIDDDFFSIDDRTQQEREDDDNISLVSEKIPYDDKVTIEDVLEPPFFNTEKLPELPTVSELSKNIFIVTIKDIIEPPPANTIPPYPQPKTLDVDINPLSDNILKNLRPVGNRNLQNLIEDDFIPIYDRTQQEREDDDNISLAGEALPIINIDTTSAWDQNKTEVARPGPIIKLSTDFEKKVKASKKIKNKYLKKKIGQKNTQNKISKDWLKTAGYLDTKDQDKINYIFVSPKKLDQNKIDNDAGHFIRTEIDSTDFKRENLASKSKKSKKSKKNTLFKNSKNRRCFR